MQQDKTKNNTIALKLIFFCLLFLAGSIACTEKNKNVFQGYVEGEYLHIAAPSPGRLVSLQVEKGQSVKGGRHLFTLDKQRELAQLEQARHESNRAKALLQDLQKGKRQPKLDAIRAQLQQAKIALEFSKTDYQRHLQLFKKGSATRHMLDRLQTDLQKNRQQIKKLQADLSLAKLGGREDAIRAARALVQAKQAIMEKFRWDLEQRVQTAPENGLIFETFFEPGEWVPAGRPVVSMLPPQNRKIIFFIPEEKIAAVTIQDRVQINMDGGKSLAATVSYISPEPEYTPPIIYSSRSRAKLVFLVEARPKSREAVNLHPGQPVDVQFKSGKLSAKQQ